MGDLAPLLQVGGPAGVLLAALVLAFRWFGSDRTRYLGEIKQAEDRADEAEGRARALQAELDAERRERRRIEDEMAAEIRRLREQVEGLSVRVARLQAQVGGGP